MKSTLLIMLAFVENNALAMDTMAITFLEARNVTEEKYATNHSTEKIGKSLIFKLRRTKSFSASKNEPFSTSFEPQRKSCDVRVRSTLSNLFHQDLKPQNDKPPELNDIRPRVLDQPVDKQEAQEEEDEKDEIRVVEEPKVNVNEIVEVIEELESVSLEVDELTNNGSGGANGNGNGNLNVNVNVNAKVAPSGVDYVQGVRVGFNEREFGSNSMREDCYSEKMFDVGVIGNGDGNGNGKGGKKGRRWRWSIWGFIHRRGGNKDEDEDRYSRVNGVERSYSETWGGDGRGGGGGGGGGGGFNGRMLRSNSSVSWRNAQGVGNGGGGFGGFRRNGVQGNGNGKKGKEEFVLERNRSARYSPNNIDNGLLRFYLTPMRGSRRNGSVKSRSNQAHSIARSVLGLY
ncbi:UPF0503 protein [Vigna angularis]|uniref:UPF0503 protein n=1 Tax=Phaseolus angularis TaxID=3914 RepID=A0A8T0JS41_PHAAN|nr:UPF0503 protein [Vigna angularis]